MNENRNDIVNTEFNHDRVKQWQKYSVGVFLTS